MTDGGRRPSRPALAIHVLVLVGGFMAGVSCALGHRGLAGAERSVWAPHNEHWSTGPIHTC